MRSDILDKARADLAAVQKEHASLVHKAYVQVKASKAKYDASKKRVMDLEFAVITAEASIAADKRRAR
jgi:hypothetical protein